MTSRRAVIRATLLAAVLAGTTAPASAVVGASGPDAVIELPAGLTVEVLRTSADPGSASISGCDADTPVAIQAYAVVPVGTDGLETQIPILFTSPTMPADGVVGLPLSAISDWLDETDVPPLAEVVLHAWCYPDEALATRTIPPGDGSFTEGPPDTSQATKETTPSPTTVPVPLLAMAGVIAVAALLRRRRGATP